MVLKMNKYMIEKENIECRIKIAEKMLNYLKAQA